jgi:hypothetical protein
LSLHRQAGDSRRPTVQNPTRTEINTRIKTINRINPMNTAQKSSLLAVALFAATLVGCKGPDLVMAPNTTADDPLPAGAYPEIVLLDGLETVLVKQDVQTSIDPRTGMFTVQATLRSVSAQNTPYQYRLKFFDETGEQINRHNIVWKGGSIAARTRTTITERAINTKASRFEMEIRKPR